MKTKPIIFSGPMVRAVLEGRKTQARRPVKFRMTRDRYSPWPQCPYGDPGDKLWVRETHRFVEQDRQYFVEYVDGARVPVPDTPKAAEYVAGRTDKLRPSVHMPKWASRLMLNVVHTVATPLQNITEADAQAEGWPLSGLDGKAYDPVTMETAREWFAGVWDDMYETRGRGWKVNPWVWVIEFNMKALPKPG